MSIFDVFRKKKKKIPAPWAKYYTKEELNYKIPNISLYEQVRLSSIKYPKFLAIKYMNKKITYQDFVKKIDQASRSFKSLGIRKGDVVTICMPNLPEALITFYALNKLGAIGNMLQRRLNKALFRLKVNTWSLSICSTIKLKTL